MVYDNYNSAQMLDAWNIYLQNWAILEVNVGKYSIHGAFGMIYDNSDYIQL